MSERIEELKMELEQLLFEDRIVDNPNRKKIKIIDRINDEIIADIDYANQPRQEGTIVKASYMNYIKELILDGYEKSVDAIKIANEAKNITNGAPPTFDPSTKVECDASNLDADKIKLWQEKLNISGLTTDLNNKADSDNPVQTIIAHLLSATNGNFTNINGVNISSLFGSIYAQENITTLNSVNGCQYGYSIIFRQLNNGYRYQLAFGRTSSGSGSRTVTYPTAFKSTSDYVAISLMVRSKSTNYGWGYMTGKTATNSTFLNDGDVSEFIAIGRIS